MAFSEHRIDSGFRCALASLYKSPLIMNEKACNKFRSSWLSVPYTQTSGSGQFYSRKIHPKDWAFPAPHPLVRASRTNVPPRAEPCRSENQWQRGRLSPSSHKSPVPRPPRQERRVRVGPTSPFPRGLNGYSDNAPARDTIGRKPGQ